MGPFPGDFCRLGSIHRKIPAVFQDAFPWPRVCPSLQDLVLSSSSRDIRAAVPGKGEVKPPN